MTKREKVLSSIIGFLLVVIAIVGYKAYDYRKNLLEKKKIIVQKDELFKKSIRYGYEALIRTEYVDAIRTYMIRHPFNTNSLAVDLQTSIRKSEESATNFGSSVSFPVINVSTTKLTTLGISRESRFTSDMQTIDMIKYLLLPLKKYKRSSLLVLNLLCFISSPVKQI